MVADTEVTRSYLGQTQTRASHWQCASESHLVVVVALAPVAGHFRSDRVPISANGPERMNTAKCKLSFVPQNNHERVSPEVCRIPDRQSRTRDDHAQWEPWVF
jgi:hypothetical protein